MKSNQQILRDSFSKISKDGDRFVEAFYENLFTQFPQVKALFPEAMDRQEHKLLIAIITIVEAIDQPEMLDEFLTQLGELHKQFKVKAEYFPLFRQVMLDTLAQFLSDDWTPELAKIWGEAINMFAKGMLKAYKTKK